MLSPFARVHDKVHLRWRLLFLANNITFVYRSLIYVKRKTVRLTNLSSDGIVSSCRKGTFGDQFNCFIAYLPNTLLLTYSGDRCIDLQGEFINKIMCYTRFDLLKFAYKKICFCLHLAGDSDETSMTK